MACSDPGSGTGPDAGSGADPGSGSGSDDAGRGHGSAVPERVRRRLDDVFGDVLPEITRDERAGREVGDAGDAPAAGSAGTDDWLRANRPPHHDQG